MILRAMPEQRENLSLCTVFKGGWFRWNEELIKVKGLILLAVTTRVKKQTTHRALPA